jgi:type I restriction enzyme S subunit
MLGEVLNYEQPNKYIVESTTYDDSYKIPVLTAGQSFVLGYTNETENIYDNLPCIIFDDFTTSIQYVDFPFKVKSSAMKILTTDVNENDIRYLYYRLSIIKVDTGLHKRYWISRFAPMHIEIPELKEQRKIANILDKISALITERKKQIENLDLLVKSQFVEMFQTMDLSENRPNWVDIKDIATIYTGTTPSVKEPENWDGNILWVTPAELSNDSFYVFDTVRKITKKGQSSKSLPLMPINTVLLSTRAPIGKVAIVGKEMTCNQGFKNFFCNPYIINPIYLYTILRNNTEYLNTLGTGTTFKEISKSNVGEIRIPVPPITIQNKFADCVKLIDKSKFEIQQGLERLELQYNALMQQYFG